MSLTTQAREALKSWYRRARARVSPNGEYDKLTPVMQGWVDLAKMRAKDLGESHQFRTPGGDQVYAYPCGGGRIAWGINHAETGENYARGVFPAEQEMAS